MALTVDQIIALRGNAYNRSVASYAIAIFGMIGCGWLVAAYGMTGPLPIKLTLVVVAGSVGLYAALALPAIWSELAALRADRADGLAGTNYEAEVAKQPYSLYGNLPVAAALGYFVMIVWALFG